MKSIQGFFRKQPIVTQGLILYLVVLVVHLIYSLTHIAFGQDVARDVVLMERFKSQDILFIPYGPKASVGNFYLPPFYYQFHYFVYLLFPSPLVMQWVTTIIESLTPVLIFLVLRFIVASPAALLSAFLYSFFAMPLRSGTIAWNPNMIPFFSTLALFFWYRTISFKKYIYIIFALVSTTIAFHLHYQSVVVIPFSILMSMVVLFKNPKALPYWFAGVIFSILTFLPYVVSEVSNNYPNTSAIVNYFFFEHANYFDRVSKLGFVLNFLPSFIERIILGTNFQIPFIGCLIFFGGFLLLLIKSLRSRKALLLFTYFALILIMLRVYKGDKLDYYMSTLYIFPAIAIALIIEKFKYFAYILIAFLVLGAGFTLADPPFNDFDTHTNVMSQLSKTVGNTPFSIIFQDDNYMNIVAFGLLKYPNLRINKNSRLLVDICDSMVLCDWDGVKECRESRQYSYSSYLKSNSLYTKSHKLNLSRGFQYVVGTKEKPYNFSNYSLYDINMKYGTDSLLPEFYK